LLAFACAMGVKPSHRVAEGIESPYPQYSPDFERMIGFVQRLRGRLAASR